MATGNPSLRHLDRSRECRQRNCQKPESMWIAETKCHPGREKDQEMLKIVWGGRPYAKNFSGWRLSYSQGSSWHCSSARVRPANNQLFEVGAKRAPTELVLLGILG